MSWLFKYGDSRNDKIRKDIKKLSKHVLTIPHDGKEYKLYELATIHDMPAKRYQIMNQFVEDARLNIQKEDLSSYLQELEDNINKAIKENDPVGLTNAMLITRWLKTRTNISLDVDLVMRVLTSVLLFEDEDPLDYDWDINDFKIELFEKYGVTAFFLSEPIKRYLQLITTSTIDIEAILEQRRMKQLASKELKGMGISVFDMSKRNTKEQDIT